MLGHFPTPASHEQAIVDSDYVAVCIAEQIVRIKLSAARLCQARPELHDHSRTLVQPLLVLAGELNVTEPVRAYVQEAAPGAIL